MAASKAFQTVLSFQELCVKCLDLLAGVKYGKYDDDKKIEETAAPASKAAVTVPTISTEKTKAADISTDDATKNIDSSKTVHGWTVVDVSTWLHNIGLDDSVSLFASKGVGTC